MLGAILGAAGAIGSSLLSKSAASDQAALQEKFAKNAIQWKVKDATKAGIHPLYALGANTVSYSPVSVGQPDLGAMGQDIGGAIDRVSNPQEKASGALSALALERAGLENDLLRAQIARARINVAGQAAMAALPEHKAMPPSQQLGPFFTGDDVLKVPDVTSGGTWEEFASEIGGNVGGILNLDKLLEANPKILWNPSGPTVDRMRKRDWQSRKGRF